MKHVAALLVIGLLALPIAVVLTWMLAGFWNWFEGVSGIESIGHSGPAGWCYLAVLVVTVSAGMGTWFFVILRKK